MCSEHCSLVAVFDLRVNIHVDVSIVFTFLVLVEFGGGGGEKMINFYVGGLRACISFCNGC